MTQEDFFELCNKKKPGCAGILKGILRKHPDLELQQLLDKNEPPYVIIAHFIYHENNGDRIYLESLYEELGGGFNPSSETLHAVEVVITEEVVK